MNGWYILSFPAWLVLAITAASRLSDMGRDQWAKRHHVRRLGLIGAGALSVMMLLAPFTEGWTSLFREPATWRTWAFAWCWSCVWLTTPGMPPWYDFILGVHRDPAVWKGLTWRQRLVAEWRALRNSFRPYRLREPMGPTTAVKVVNVIGDPAMDEYLRTPAGEAAILKHTRQDPGSGL